MLRDRIRKIEEHLRSFVQDHYRVELGTLIVETPPRPELGDLAFPFPFELAKVLRKAPRAIAQEVVEALPPNLLVSRFEAAGAGYVNCFFERVGFFRDLFMWLHSPAVSSNGDKVIVEHTNINPNKAAHIGHLRNAALGDTFVRLLRASGQPVEIQNYIDNTGVQVADVVVGFEQLRDFTLEQVKTVEEPFDYYCWDLYAEVSEWFRDGPSRLDFRHRALKEIEEGVGPTARLAEYVSNRIVLAHLRTMQRLGVRYDVLPRESEILKLNFWDEAFARLKEREAIQYVADGPNRGCWVMRLPGDEESSLGEEKVIVRSNGTVTYVGKDIAYQLWKFGLLDKTFRFRRFYTYDDGKEVWTTAAESSGEQPSFGHGRRVYNVIDTRQSYLQRVVVQALRSLGYEDEASHSIHFSYEMVALSPACCTELGIELSDEDRSRPYVEVSGRKGLGVKADDLIDKLIEKSLGEVNSRQKGLEFEKRQRIAEQIAVGALRYFLLKYTRNSVISFDFSEALNFEGETGPYLQYSVVRAGNIFRKLAAQGNPAIESNWKLLQAKNWDNPRLLESLLCENDVWSLILQTSRLDEVIDQSLRTLEVTYLAKHAFALAQLFNLFYHRCHILSEPDEARKAFFLTVADSAQLGLIRSLDLLGIEVPEKM